MDILELLKQIDSHNDGVCRDDGYYALPIEVEETLKAVIKELEEVKK